jgi:hypothetical protein
MKVRYLFTLSLATSCSLSVAAALPKKNQPVGTSQKQFETQTQQRNVHMPSQKLPIISPPFTQQDYSLYCAARSIASKIHELGKKYDCGLTDCQKDSLCHVGYASQGLCLDYQGKKIPCALLTPWGLWKFVGTSNDENWQSLQKELAQYATTTLFLQGASGSRYREPTGPHYYVTHVGNQRLPEPLVQLIPGTTRNRYSVSDIVQLYRYEQWDAMTRQWEKEKRS